MAWLTGSCGAPPVVPGGWAAWAAAASLLTVRAVTGPLAALQRRAGWLRPNWRGHRLPLPGGPALAAGLAAGVFVATVAAGSWPRAHAGLAAVLAGALFGLFDDAAGGAGARGWRAHGLALLRGRWTTGSAKIAGIGLAALAAAGGACARDASPLILVLAGGLVAATANAVNLLDTRPGRALKAVLAGALLAGMAAGDRGAWLLVVAAAALALLPRDLQERAMLGDGGANALGAALGYGLVLAAGRIGPLLAWLALLLALQAAGDRWSLGRCIERVRPLRALDALGRPSPPGGNVRAVRE